MKTPSILKKRLGLELEHARLFGRVGLVLLLSSLMPILGLPLPLVHAAPVTTLRVDARTWVCQSAKYNVASVQTIAPVWKALGLDTDEVIAGAVDYADAACAPGATGATAKKGYASYKASMSSAVIAYGKKVGLSAKLATRRLWIAQLTFLEHSFSCGRANPDNVGKFLRGINVGPIDIAGASLASGSGINPIAPGQLGTCGGSGGGRDIGIPIDLDPSKLQSCVQHYKPVMDGCGFIGDDVEDEAEEAAAEAAEKDKAKTYKAKVEMKDGTVTVTGSDGSKLVIEKVPNDQSEDWAEIAIEAFGVLTALGAVVSVTLSAPLVATALASVSAVMGLIVLLKHVKEEMDEKPYNIVLNPRLCPIQVGDRVAWLTNPDTGIALGEFDSFSTCSCSSSKVRPTRCNSSGQKQLDKMTACLANPYALYVDAPVCKDNAISSNPWLNYNTADAAACGYKDCGPLSYGGIAGGGCACSTANAPGGPRIPGDLMYDPSPIDLGGVIIGIPGKIGGGIP